MADSRVCKIEGCGKPVRARVWCGNHYERFRKYGDPLGGGTSPGEGRAFLENTVLPYEGDECLIWPYGTTSAGYGEVWRDGKNRMVHREVCEAEHGPPPTTKHQAAHSCGKGHEGCVNRKHLTWKTPKENNSDKLLHGTINRGTRNGAAKLTEAQVLEILANTRSVAHLAKEFGISQSTIFRIRQRKYWTHL